MVDSRAKGRRGEYAVRDLFRQYTGIKDWERVPASGALSYLKGDIYIANEDNRFMIEVKNYEESLFDIKIFTNKSNKFLQFWEKSVEQASYRDQEPLLIFKFARSKYYIGTSRKPKNTDKYLYINWLDCYLLMLEDWLELESEGIEWLKDS